MKANVRVLGRDRGEKPVTLEAVASAGGKPVDERPRSVYEMLTRQMLEEVKRDVGDVKGRVNALLWLVVGSTVVEIVSKLIK